MTGQYQNALKTAEANAQARDQFESQFKQASADYEAARAEADQYREEAVGQQLRAVRSGSTVGGANQSQNLTGGLTSGRTGYSSDEGDISKLAESMRAQGGLTDSVLSREGPVVQQLSRGGQKPGQSASKAQAAVLAPALITHPVSVEVKMSKREIDGRKFEKNGCRRPSRSLA